MFDKISALLPERYKKLLSGRTSKIIVFTFIAYMFLDVTLGLLVVKYLDPIAFSREHPYLVLSVFFIIAFLVKYIFRKKKS